MGIGDQTFRKQFRYIICNDEFDCQVKNITLHRLSQQTYCKLWSFTWLCAVTNYLNCIVVYFMVVKCGDLELYISIKFVQPGISQYAKFATAMYHASMDFRPAHESTPYQLSIAETSYKKFNSMAITLL